MYSKIKVLSLGNYNLEFQQANEVVDRSPKKRIPCRDMSSAADWVDLSPGNNTNLNEQFQRIIFSLVDIELLRYQINYITVPRRTNN